MTSSLRANLVMIIGIICPLIIWRDNLKRCPFIFILLLLSASRRCERQKDCCEYRVCCLSHSPLQSCSRGFLKLDGSFNGQDVKEVIVSKITDQSFICSIPSFRELFIEASDVAPLTVSLSIPTDARKDGPSSTTNSQNSMRDIKVNPADSMRKVMDVAIESVMEAVAEVVPAISLVSIVTKMGEDLPDGIIETAKTIDSPCPIGGIEVIELQEPEISVFDACSTKILTEMMPPVPLSSSAVDRLKIAAELLGSHLDPVDKWALDEEDAQH